jgi:hypothetical protein|tara:strand:- start:136 stop:348 length:213 start_codon:yes stop_codon:yes gene_type:complete
MIKVGDLVEWKEMTNAKKRRFPYGGAAVIGVVVKTKTRCLDGINEAKLFQVHFPDRQQYWIVSDCLNKIS